MLGTVVKKLFKLLCKLTYFWSQFKAPSVLPPEQPLALEQEINSWTLSSITGLSAMAHWLSTHSVAVNALCKRECKAIYSLTKGNLQDTRG